MNNKIKPFYTLAKIFCPIILICSVLININQCTRNNTLRTQLANKEIISSKKDSLISVTLNSDSIPVSNFGVQNLPEISGVLLQKKIDSLAIKEQFGGDILRANKGGFYSKSKFTATLKDVKPSLDNDSIAEYINNNWYINYNKVSSIFNARYQGEHETLTTFVPKYTLGNWNLTKPDLTSYKWSDDKDLVITESETIYVPTPVKQNKFELYLNSEVRQGVEIQNKTFNTLENTNSGHVGLGIGYKFNRHKIGLEGNYKAYGNEFIPKTELKLKYQFHITK